MSHNALTDESKDPGVVNRPVIPACGAEAKTRNLQVGAQQGKLVRSSLKLKSLGMRLGVKALG